MIELTYFSSPTCSVCLHLKPRLKQAVGTSIRWTDIDISKAPEKAAANTVFTVPVVILTFEGQELARFVRVFGVQEVVNKIEDLQRKLS